MKRRVPASRRSPISVRAYAAFGALAILGASLLLWLLTPLPTTAARYLWRTWHAPRLALLLDTGDARLAMEIGDNYFGSIVLGRAEQRFDPDLAAWAFDRALAIEPGIPFGHYQLSRIAFIEGHFAAAEREIDAELAANPSNLRSLYVRGLIEGYRRKAGDLARAEADFARFIDYAPGEWAGYNDLSWILIDERKYGEADALLARAFAAVPRASGNPWLWNELGVARLDGGDRAGAVSAFKSALAGAERLAPRDWRAAYSGDDPAGDIGGLDAFVAGIRRNLAAAEGTSTRARPAPVD